jgi:flavorubredoxin
MQARRICDGIEALCGIHWERRLFDALIPLPDGTSYNSYLVRGSRETALIDTTDPALKDELLAELAGLERLDHLVVQHVEQDHSGVVPDVLARFPAARLLCSEKARDLLFSHLGVPAERIRVVADGERLSLGGLTLVFVHTPWAHWPETMSTHVPEARCVFTCDLFGAHLAATDLFAADRPRVLEAAKRYYAEIMMPFRPAIARNTGKIGALGCSLIAPSHGPVHDAPEFILDAYREWTSPQMRNEVVLPYVSMHGSTGLMVKRLINALAARGVRVHPFDLAVTDIGKLAMALVDAATLIVGTPTVHAGPHPAVSHAAGLAGMLRPKLKYAAVIGSYGWGGRAAERLAEAISGLGARLLGTVMRKGAPDEETFREIENLAATVARAHAEDPLVVAA